MKEKILSMEGIYKSFFGVNVLQDINFDLERGEVRALMGENGAGKSTLMKILSGVYSMDSGEIRIHGKKVEIKNPLDARRYKVCIVHQEIALAENMTIADNVFLGAELSEHGFVNKKQMVNQAQNVIDSLHLNISVNTKISKLSIAQQQLVEIAKALNFQADIIILDEPTASISEDEAQQLFEKIEELKKKGISFIYISHRMEEIFKICDSISVMRDGRMIATKKKQETTMQEIVALMVGRPLNNVFGEKYCPEKTENILKVENLTNRYLKDVSFELKKGEILGFSGLVGAGRTEVARAIFGIDPIQSGKIILEGKEIHIRNVSDAMKCGIGLVPEDRKGTGLLLNKSVGYNLTLLVLKEFVRAGRVDHKKEKEIIDQYSKKLSIKMASAGQHAKELSGGNQQKIVISKWLAFHPKILILDEPTRGIDVGAKAEIYELIKNLAKEGYAIIMISSELPEILNISNRIMVMHEGKVTAILNNDTDDLTQEKVMKYAMGGL